MNSFSLKYIYRTELIKLYDALEFHQISFTNVNDITDQKLTNIIFFGSKKSAKKSSALAP